MKISLSGWLVMAGMAFAPSAMAQAPSSASATSAAGCPD